MNFRTLGTFVSLGESSDESRVTDFPAQRMSRHRAGFSRKVFEMTDTPIKEPVAIEDASGRYADRVYEQILGQIVAGDFKIGDRLPSENQLGTEYDVSRAVVREALARLYADGVTVTRRGAGTYVQRQLGREF